ncbi:MAG: P-type ATPase [Acidimicrobiia bacterium]
MPAFTWTPLDVLPRLPRPRRRWVTAGRAHIEVRSLPPEELAVFTDQVEAALAEHEAVLWAEVNPFVRRVVVAFEPERVSAQALVAIIEDVERVCEVHHRPFPRDAPEHPGDIEPLLRDGLSLGADLVGIGFGLFSRLVPVPSIVRADVGAFAKLLEGAPPLRRSLEHRVGAPITELALDVFGAVTQGLAFGPVGPMVDLAHRTVGLLEHRARGAAWSRREPELCAEPTGGLVAVTVEPRPVPVPPGPVETYTDRAWYGTVAAVAGSLALTRSMERAAAAVYAGAPRAAHFGRHAFAAQLSRVLAARGVVPLDPGALRLLDRADCVVVEGALLLNARHAVAQVHTLADVSDPEARRRAGLLFDPDRPDASVERDRWSLAPATEAAVDRARRVLSSTHDATGAGASYLALAHDGRPVALVETRPTLVPGAAELLDAVSRRDMRPVVVRQGADRLGVLGDVELVEPGPAATEAVRALQRDGHVVLAIAGRDLDLLAAADCSVGMCGPGHPTPWAADLLAGDDLADAFLVVEAAHAARAVSRQSVTIAGAGAAFGLLLAFGGRVPGSARRASAAVNVAAAATVLNGLRGGLRLARLPLRLDHDPTPWHALAPDAALAQLETSSVGLTGDQAARRRRPVARTAPLPLRFAGSVAGELVNPLTPVLAGGAVLSVLVGSFGDAMMVGTVMGVDALIGGVQRYRTDRAIERLGRRDGRTITARRDGSDLTVDAATVVPGDVIHVRAGDTVPADCRILEGAHLETDESSLTGESMPVRRAPSPSWLRWSPSGRRCCTKVRRSPRATRRRSSSP